MKPSHLSPFVRIGLRYLAGLLVARGVIGMDTAELIMSDPAFREAVVGLLVMAGTEAWYALARRRGGER